MSDGFLLATNIVLELTRARIEPKVQSWVAAQQLGSLSIRVVSVGEMEKGFTIMSDLPKRSRLETWLEVQLIELFRGQVLPVTHGVAKRWGLFDGVRQMAGRPLFVTDGMIAATAFEHGLAVVTRNARDFEGLGLTLINPWETT